MKHRLLRLALAPGLRAAYAPLLRGRAAIFTFHRFVSPVSGAGYDPQRLERMLERLRRDRVRVLPLDELLRRLAGEGPPADGCVAFTIDDGYADQAEIAAPIFARYDCPVTTFVVTGFLDRRGWLWWDRVEYALERTRRRAWTMRVADEDRTWSWDSDAERHAVTARIVALAKTLPEPRKLELLDGLERTLEVERPRGIPDRYAPMTWDRLRACRGGGMSFGPHTVTHPILSRVDDDRARTEIEDSWRRLCEEDDRAVPIFAYPNGEPGDYGPREAALLSETGCVAAVTGTRTYVEAGSPSDPTARWTIPRFGEPAGTTDLRQVTSGFARLKRILRGA